MNYNDNSSKVFTINNNQTLSFCDIVNNYPDAALRLIFSGNVPLRISLVSRASISPVDFLWRIRSLKDGAKDFAESITRQTTPEQSKMGIGFLPQLEGNRRRGVSLPILTSKEPIHQENPQLIRKRGFSL